jgi:hypothetical protein
MLAKVETPHGYEAVAVMLRLHAQMLIIQTWQDGRAYPDTVARRQCEHTLPGLDT